MIPSTPPSSRPSPKGAEPGPRPIYPHPDHWVPDRFASGMTAQKIRLRLAITSKAQAQQLPASAGKQLRA